MKKLLFLLLYIPLAASAQLPGNPFLHLSDDTLSVSPQWQLGAAYNIASNSLSNSFYNGILLHRFLGNEDKADATGRLKTDNRLLAYSESYGMYIWRPKASAKSMLCYLLLKNRLQYSSGFPTDAFRLVFYGNQMFAGQTVNVDNTSYRKINYQQFQFGMVGLGERLTYGGGIGLVKGSRVVDLDVRRGSLYTSEWGDSLHMFADASMRSAEQGPGLLKAGGLGLAFSGFLHYQMNRSSINLVLSDLGFISWFGNKTEVQEVNRSSSFTGAQVNFFEFSRSTNSLSIGDSLRNTIIPGADKKAFTTVLPFQSFLEYQYRPDSAWLFSAGIDYIGWSRYPPYIYLSGSRRLSTWFRMTAGLGGLADGTLGVQLMGDFSIAKKWLLSVGTMHAEAYLAPRSTSGQGLFFSLKWKLRE